MNSVRHMHAHTRPHAPLILLTKRAPRHQNRSPSDVPATTRSPSGAYAAHVTLGILGRAGDAVGAAAAVAAAALDCELESGCDCVCAPAAGAPPATGAGAGAVALAAGCGAPVGTGGGGVRGRGGATSGTTSLRVTFLIRTSGMMKQVSNGTRHAGETAHPTRRACRRRAQ